MDAEIVWLAGLWDGEGCFTTHQDRSGVPKPRAVIRMTSFPTIERVWDITRRHHVGSYVSTWDPGGNGRPVKVLSSDGFMRAPALAELILPHLFTKREAAMTLLAYAYSRRMRMLGQKSHFAPLDDREALLLEHLRWVNQKGVRTLNEHTPDPRVDVAKMCSDLHREMQSRMETYDRLQRRAQEMYEAGATLAEIVAETGMSTTWPYTLKGYRPRK